MGVFGSFHVVPRFTDTCFLLFVFSCTPPFGLSQGRDLAPAFRRAVALTGVFNVHDPGVRHVSPSLVRCVPPGTDLCPAQGVPGTTHSPRRRPAPTAASRGERQSQSRQQTCSAAEHSQCQTHFTARVPSKFSKSPLPRARSAASYKGVTGHATVTVRSIAKSYSIDTVNI